MVNNEPVRAARRGRRGSPVQETLLGDVEWLLAPFNGLLNPGLEGDQGIYFFLDIIKFIVHLTVPVLDVSESLVYSNTPDMMSIVIVC